MISFSIVLSFIQHSPSLAYIGSLVLAISVIFVVQTTGTKVFKIVIDPKKPFDDTIYYKNNVIRVVSLFPYSHIYEFFNRILETDSFWIFENTVTKKKYDHQWWSLFKIGNIMTIIILIKIFILERINTSILDEKIFNLFKSKLKINEIDDIDVISEREYTYNEENDTNSILIIRNLNKLYISFVRRMIIYACKGVSFSLRKNEVNIIFVSVLDY